MAALPPKRIVILPQPKGGIVAHYAELGKLVGEFLEISSGEIHFRYCGEARRLYVNKTIAAFREAATVFNRCCELHADDEDTDNEAAWSSVAAQLKRDFERIEPLGDPETSLWGATIHETKMGLLTLY